MRALPALLIALAVCGCTNQPDYCFRADYRVPGADASIAVLLEHTHPDLAEYGRTVAIVERGRIATTARLYADTGGGSLANLYLSADGTYLLIDMNGNWFRIDPARRKVGDAGWHWEEPPAGRYVGCFTFNDEETDFVFRAAHEKPETSPYLFKDPEPGR